MPKGMLREMSAEFLGTFILIAFGCGVVAQVVIGGGSTGEYVSINVAWGVAVTLGVYAAGATTGGHLNPAVTLAMAVWRGFPWRKVLPYSVAQFAGAFVASVVVYVTYREAILDFTGGDYGLDTAGIWATYPQPYLSTFPGGLIDQIVGTALLLLCVFALSDPRNAPPKANLGPVVVGSVVFLIGTAFGHNCGYAINPARDLAPRLFTYMAGWGDQVFLAGNSWWWVPVVGPLIGGCLGGLLYNLFVGWHHPADAAELSE